MLEGENADVIGKDSIVDREGKARHEVVPDIALDGAPSVRRIEDRANRSICGV